MLTGWLKPVVISVVVVAFVGVCYAYFVAAKGFYAQEKKPEDEKKKE